MEKNNKQTKKSRKIIAIKIMKEKFGYTENRERKNKRNVQRKMADKKRKK
jgi:hypothetical protein